MEEFRIFPPTTILLIITAIAHDSLMSYHVYTYSRSSPSGKAAGEEVPMEDNPAYGHVNIYDTVKEPKEN